MPAPGPDQVLVQVKARPVNPSDHLFAKGVYRKKPVYPQIAGLEGAGIIVECGSAVTGYEPGDHVAFRAMNTWAEYCAVPQQQLIRINKDIPFEISCQIGLNAITAVALLEEAALQTGNALLLSAASSSVAGIIIQMAVSKGIRVVALVNDKRHTAALQTIGAANVLLQDDPALASQLKNISGGEGFHAFFDAVGGDILTAVIPLMAPYGYIALYGNYGNNAPASFTNGAIIYRNLTITGFGIDHWLAARSTAEIQQAYNSIVAQLYDKTLSFRPSATMPLEIFPADSSLPVGKLILI